MTTNIDTAVPMSAASCQPGAGSPRCGSPCGTWPSTATPRPARFAAWLTLIAAITAISRPGILRVTARAASAITMTPADTARSATWACGSARAMSRSLAGVLVSATVTPSMSGSCLAAPWMPTPVRNPTRTVRDRKFARNPTRASRASSSSPPASRVASPPAGRIAASQRPRARPGPRQGWPRSRSPRRRRDGAMTRGRRRRPSGTACTGRSLPASRRSSRTREPQGCSPRPA